MDKKDERIMVELIKNSRIPINQLAKKIGISREVANYRINKLIEEKIIRKFYLEIDESKLGFIRFGCIVQLKGVSEKEEEEMMKKISQNKYVTYIGPIIGKWNFAFDILVKDQREIEKVLSEIFFGYKTKIKEYVLNAIPTERGFFPAKIFGSVFEDKRKSKKKFSLTKRDLDILKILRDNARADYSYISKKVGLTGNAIKHRIKNLERAGIIESYTIEFNYNKLGFEFYNLQIKFFDYNFLKLKEFLYRNKFVKYFYKHVGNPDWNLDLGLLVKSNEDLREFLTDIRKKFGEVVEINDVYFIPEIIKENIAPDILFE